MAVLAWRPAKLLCNVLYILCAHCAIDACKLGSHEASPLLEPCVTDKSNESYTSISTMPPSFSISFSIHELQLVAMPPARYPS